MAQVRVAVLGAGILGSRHARVFSEQAESRTVAVVDPNSQRAGDVAGKVGAKVYDKLDDLLQEPDSFDAMAVATPDHLHAEAVLAAIRLGKHVFVEKPLATTPADAAAIAAAVEKGSVTVMVNYSQRFAPDYAAIKRIIEAGDIGEPAMVTSHKYDTIHVPTKMIGWAAATSPFFFMSSHDIDLVHWYVGRDPVEVVARERRGTLSAAGIAVHDGLNVMIQFGTDVAANFHASWIHPNTYPVVADGFLQVIGTQGVVTLYNRQRRLEVFTRKSASEQVFTGPHTANELEGRLQGGFTDSVRHFLTCIEEGREPDTSPRRTMPVSNIQFAAMQAIRTGQAVPLLAANP